MEGIQKLREEVASIIADRVGRQEVVNARWLVEEVLASRCDVHGSDVDFYKTTARVYVHDIAKKAIQKYDAQVEDSCDEQLVLEGFKHLRKAYSLDRGGDRVLVPIEKMTLQEANKRAEELYLMGVAEIEHAAELRAYIQDRWGYEEPAA